MHECAGVEQGTWRHHAGAQRSSSSIKSLFEPCKSYACLHAFHTTIIYKSKITAGTGTSISVIAATYACTYEHCDIVICVARYSERAQAWAIERRVPYQPIANQSCTISGIWTVSLESYVIIGYMMHNSMWWYIIYGEITKLGPEYWRCTRCDQRVLVRMNPSCSQPMTSDVDFVTMELTLDTLPHMPGDTKYAQHVTRQVPTHYKSILKYQGTLYICALILRARANVYVCMYVW